MNPLTYGKYLYLLCFALVLTSCAKYDGFEERTASKLVISAVLEAGATVNSVHCQGLAGSSDRNGISGLEIKISSAQGNVILTEDPSQKGIYQGPEDFIIEAEMDYTLETSYSNQVISSHTSTPPSMELLEASKDYLDASIQGDLVFLEWSGVNTGSFNQYFYVVELTSLEDSPASIKADDVEPLKSSVVSYTSEATLSIDDFNFFGDHLIRVYALDKEFEELFIAQGNSNQDGPSNIEGAFGYFLGSSVVETQLEIR